MKKNKQEDYVRALQERIEKCNRIVEGLENNAAFKELLEDFKVVIKNYDDEWHTVSDEKQLKELRIRKMAAKSMLDCLSLYKNDINVYGKELVKLQNPNELINKDFDNA